MKNQVFAVVGWLLCASMAEAQVVNDDCSGGFAQGVWMLPINSNNCDQPGSGLGLVITDSTDLAIPNFPYPTIPAPCIGYSPNVSVGGKDRWYSFRVNCDLEFTAECSDSCHISFWSGADCSMLIPISCYTLLPGQSLTGLVNAFWIIPSLDTLSMQISDNGNSAALNYQVCLKNPSPPCVSFYVEPDPTPVTCFTYSTSVTNSNSLTSPNGTIAINMQLGNAPFEIDWSNGATDFMIDSLDVGEYVFAITDSLGCSVVDTLYVAFDVGTGVPMLGPKAACAMNWNDRTDCLEIYSLSQLDRTDVIVFDLTGHQVWSASVLGEQRHVRLPALANGIYCAIAKGPQQPGCALKFSYTLNP